MVKGFTEFPCKDCSKKISLHTNMLKGHDFIQVRCAECGHLARYSLVRMDAVVEKEH